MVAVCLGVSLCGSESKFFPDRVTAGRGEEKAAQDIDQMVLMREKRRKRDKEKPEEDKRARRAAKVPGVGINQEDKQRRVQ